MKQFIVPAFMVIEAESKEAADHQAAQLQAAPGFKHGVALLLDEQLETREIEGAHHTEIHSICDIYSVSGMPAADVVNAGRDADELRKLCAQLLADLQHCVADRADSNLPEWERRAEQLGVTTSPVK